MRASTVHKFCYIAAPQCASTTIRRALDPHSDIATKEVIDLGGMQIRNHSSPKAIRKALRMAGHDIGQFFFFSSVRNPWDRMVSRHSFALKSDLSTWKQYVTGEGDFRSFLLHPEVQRRARGHCYEAWFLKADGSCIIDDMIRVEHIEEDMRRIFARIGLPAPKIPHANRNRADDERDYRKHYDDETRALVADIFASDIARFGYTF